MGREKVSIYSLDFLSSHVVQEEKEEGGKLKKELGARYVNDSVMI